MRKIAVLFVLAAFVACTKLITPTQPDADRAAQMFPGTTIADLNQGKMLYEQNCGKCHSLKKPKSRSEEAWRKIMPPMAKKAKIDKEKEDLILRYVLTMREPTKK
jgi:cytochrome c5